ncbi:hypothetical protein BT69DRAFT_1298215 [Atractiella rhizophila]|nr:hypothetical protein BT69DRAFT_1298215 [Atractiella rhizophila]
MLAPFLKFENWPETGLIGVWTFIRSAVSTSLDRPQPPSTPPQTHHRNQRKSTPSPSPSPSGGSSILLTPNTSREVSTSPTIISASTVANSPPPSPLHSSGDFKFSSATFTDRSFFTKRKKNKRPRLPLPKSSLKEGLRSTNSLGLDISMGGNNQSTATLPEHEVDEVQFSLLSLSMPDISVSRTEQKQSTEVTEGNGGEEKDQKPRSSVSSTGSITVKGDGSEGDKNDIGEAGVNVVVEDGRSGGRRTANSSSSIPRVEPSSQRSPRQVRRIQSQPSEIVGKPAAVPPIPPVIQPQPTKEVITPAPLAAASIDERVITETLFNPLATPSGMVAPQPSPPLPSSTMIGGNSMVTSENWNSFLPPNYFHAPPPPPQGQGVGLGLSMYGNHHPQQQQQQQQPLQRFLPPPTAPSFNSLGRGTAPASVYHRPHLPTSMTRITDPRRLPHPPQGRRKGRCKFFNTGKGFGFIIDMGRGTWDDNEEANNSNQVRDETVGLWGQEVFTHYSAIRPEPGRPLKFRSIAEGELVEYYVILGDKGYTALDVCGPQGRPVAGAVPQSPPTTSEHLPQPSVIPSSSPHEGFLGWGGAGLELTPSDQFSSPGTLGSPNPQGTFSSPVSSFGFSSPPQSTQLPYFYPFVSMFPTYPYALPPVQQQFQPQSGQPNANQNPNPILAQEGFYGPSSQPQQVSGMSPFAPTRQEGSVFDQATGSMGRAQAQGWQGTQSFSINIHLRVYIKNRFYDPFFLFFGMSLFLLFLFVQAEDQCQCHVSLLQTPNSIGNDVTLSQVHLGYQKYLEFTLLMSIAHSLLDNKEVGNERRACQTDGSKLNIGELETSTKPHFTS